MRKTNYLCAMFAVVVGTYASQNAMATENNGMRTVTKLQQQEMLTGVVTDTQGEPLSVQQSLLWVKTQEQSPT